MPGSVSSSLTVRELTEGDIESITAYWIDSDPDFMRSMGVDLAKLPSPEAWHNMLKEQLSQAPEQKKSYCIVWCADGKAVGHSNVNRIIFGKEAYMHLHLWQTANRHKGWGSQFVRMTLPWFFDKLKLEKLYCEPYALNPAPNRTLEKLGFVFEHEYVTTPSWINFEQPVKRWSLDSEDFFKNKKV